MGDLNMKAVVLAGYWKNVLTDLILQIGRLGGVCDRLWWKRFSTAIHLQGELYNHVR